MFFKKKFHQSVYYKFKKELCWKWTTVLFLYSPRKPYHPKNLHWMLICFLVLSFKNYETYWDFQVDTLWYLMVQGSLEEKAEIIQPKENKISHLSNQFFFQVNPDFHVGNTFLFYFTSHKNPLCFYFNDENTSNLFCWLVIQLMHFIRKLFKYKDVLLLKYL